MHRLASVFLYSAVLFSVLPSGFAGPACAAKYYQKQQCIESCKAKWGYPGAVMGGDRWGSVMRKMADKTTQAMDATISQACGFGSSSDGAAHGAIGGVTESATSTSESTSSTNYAQTSTSSSNILATTSSTTSSSSSSSIASSSSAYSLVSVTGPNLFDGFTPSTPTTTSTSSEPASTSSADDFVPTSEAPPPPPPPTTTSSSTPESTPTNDTGNNGNSGNSGNNGSATNEGSQDQGNSGSSSNPTSSNSSGSGNSGNSGSTSDSDIQAYLNAHNSIRAQHGASDLTWSDDAASKAQTWANNCVFEHSGGKLGPFGENLAAGTGGSYGIGPAIKSWTDEVSSFSSNDPQPSHFTQVVWKGTTQVGCAVASCDGIFPASFGKAQYFVCEYFPQGNIIGQFASNVQA